MLSGMKNRVAIITGSSSGIGASAAIEFAKLGAKVVIAGRHEGRIQDIAVKCQEAGLDKENTLTVVGDVTKDEDLKNLVKSTIDRFGKIHVLVNNAGYGSMGNMMQTKVEDLELMFNLHVRANYVLTKLAIPHLLETKGNIVNISSVSSIRPAPSTMPYCMAKVAQDQMTKCLALEFAHQGVRVNTVCPGATKTPAFENSGLVKAEELDQYFAFLASLHPPKRVAEAVEVARVITFLASDAASFINGAVIPVDGGIHLTSNVQVVPE